MELYSEYLKATPIVLKESMDHVRTLIINLAMTGEMKDINSTFKEGEELMFKYEDFKNLKDYNVKLLYEVYDFLEDKRNELINVNGLEDEEFEY